MDSRTAAAAPARISKAGAILVLAWAAGCEPAIVNVIEEADPAQAAAGPREARNDDCLLGVLYRVEGDLFDVVEGSAQSLRSGVAGGGGAGPDVSSPRVGVSQRLQGYDGCAHLLWGDEIVDTFTIDRAFLESGRVEVLAFGTPEGARYEYHLYTQPECSATWVPIGVLTRQQVAAHEQ